MLLPDKETIFSHDFLELSKNAFIEKRKKTDSNFVNSAKVGAYGAKPPCTETNFFNGLSAHLLYNICKWKSLFADNKNPSKLQKAKSERFQSMANQPTEAPFFYSVGLFWYK